MWGSFFGSAPAEAPKPDDEEARKRELRRKKAAAEARRKREEQPDDLAGFAVGGGGGRKAEGSRQSANGQARLVSSRPVSAPGSGLQPINEDGAARTKMASTWSAATSDPEEMKKLAQRAQAAQEQAVADLMNQVRLQQEEELNNAVAAAHQEGRDQMKAECDAKHEAEMTARLGEAAEEAAKARQAAVELAVAEAEAAAEKRMADALAAADETQAEALAEASVKESLAKQKALDELSERLERQHQATLVTSAAMVRQEKMAGDSKLEEEVKRMREELKDEHAAEVKAAVAAAEDEAAKAMAQVRIDTTNEKEDAVAKAIAETEKAVTARMEEELINPLAQRQKAFNATFKKLMTELFEQPEKLANVNLASPTAKEAALALTYAEE